MKNKLKIFISSVFLFLFFFFFIVTGWVPNNFGDTSIEQMIFTLKSPLEGSDTSFISSFLICCILIPIILSLLILFLINYNFKNKINVIVTFGNKEKREFSFFASLKRFSIYLSIIMMVISFSFCIENLGVNTYISNIINKSTIYEENYVNPKNMTFTFPESKQNLIHIYVESMETTYLSKNIGGSMEKNLIPELSQLAKENTSFSSLNGEGMYAPYGSGWTVAALVSQTGGVPLNIPIEANSYSGDVKFLPGLFNIGDILEEGGYYQEFLLGSDATFGGRDIFYKQHGNFVIKDYNYAKEEGWIPSDYAEWWGYEDEKLFEFAKSELSRISQTKKPFNFTMLTADTHHIGGYKCSKCPDMFDDQYSNVIACSSKQIFDFVSWIREQSFYENTTIVITGDHLSMDPNYFSEINEENRKVYNTFINPKTSVQTSTIRQFTSFDIFPTELASLGITWNSNKLGLGTNLFSSQKTLLEIMGKEKFDSELQKKSLYYDENILYN